MGKSGAPQAMKKLNPEAEYHAGRFGDQLFLSECVPEKTDDGVPIEPAVHGLSQLREGQNLSKDQTLYRIERSSKGHVKVKPIRLNEGPVQVSTKAYRDGWDQVFGNHTVN